jgi:hypothetical protein
MFDPSGQISPVRQKGTLRIAQNHQSPSLVGGSLTYPSPLKNMSSSVGIMTFPIPSGKRLHNYGKSPFLAGKSTISMAIFHSKLLT